MHNEVNTGEKAGACVVMEESLVDAESSIRDLDMAKEMVQSIKDNVFLQPSEAILAQAGNLPQDAQRLIG